MAFNPQFARLGEVLIHNLAVTEEELKEAMARMKTALGQLK